MILRNKKLLVTLRTILGLFMIFSGVSGLMMDISALPDMDMPANLVESTTALWNMGLFHMIKITEFVAGVMLLANFLPALAILFLSPISVGVVVVNAVLSPQFLPVGVVFGLFMIYFGYAYWDKYKAIFTK